MTQNLTIVDYAKRAGVRSQTVRYAVAHGLIELDRNGLIDVAKADSGWLANLRAKDEGAQQAETLLVSGTLSALEASIDFNRNTYESMAADYASRFELKRHVLRELDSFLHMVEAVPERYASMAAELLAIPLPLAREIMQEIADSVLADFARLEDEALQMVEAL